MKVQKVILCFLFIFIISGFLTCTIDKTPIGIEEEGECWNSKTTIRDFEYIKNRYFFVDTFYVNYFEKGWSDDLSNWIYTESRLLRVIDVFKSTNYLSQDTVRGLAVIKPQNYNDLTPSDYDTVNVVPGKVEKGHFVRLEEYVDYDYDYARGFFRVNSQIPYDEVLAVSYKTDLGQIGTFFEDIIDTTFTNLPVFRLIKSVNMNPSHTEVWPLMMKNVYYLGQTNIQSECFNVKIEYNLNGEHQTIQPVDPKKSYLYLMGLDRIDKNGSSIEGGDGIIDDNSLLIYRSDGILIFPGLYPFNPLPQSRFQIAEKADLYETNSISNLNQNYRYDIVVTSIIDE